MSLKISKGQMGGWLIIIGIFVALPFFIKSPYYLDIIISVFLYALLGIAWNIIGGYCGQISLGHVAYFGMGAYISSLLYIKGDISPWLGLVIAAGVIALLAGIFGFPALRLKGPYFVFFTIAFAEIIKVIFANWRYVGGSMGLNIPFRGTWSSFTFFSRVHYYYIIFAFMLMGLLITYLIASSKMGKYFLAIKGDEETAEALGINTALYKTIAFVISAVLMGIGGTLYAQYTLYIDPGSTMSLTISLMALLIPVIGGAGTVIGPLLGAIILIPLWEYSRALLGGRYTALSLMVIGLITMIVVLAFPKGVIGLAYKKGEIRKWWKPSTGK